MRVNRRPLLACGLSAGVALTGCGPVARAPLVQLEVGGLDRYRMRAADVVAHEQFLRRWEAEIARAC